MNQAERYKKLLAYERWANARVIESLRTIDLGAVLASGVGHATYQKAVGIFSHMQWARKIWLDRLLGKPADAAWMGLGMFPAWSLEQVEHETKQMDDGWAQWIEPIKDADLDRTVEYASVEGQRYSGVVGEMLTHVFTHGSYHRGQIAALVKQCGGTPASTDYIVFTRHAAGK